MNSFKSLSHERRMLRVVDRVVKKFSGALKKSFQVPSFDCYRNHKAITNLVKYERFSLNTRVAKTMHLKSVFKKGGSERVAKTVGTY
jgi:hypothetical protein